MIKKKKKKEKKKATAKLHKDFMCVDLKQVKNRRKWKQGEEVMAGLPPALGVAAAVWAQQCAAASYRNPAEPPKEESQR